jgi:hypothetical protein
MTTELTAADFARTAGHVGTTAMEADILVAAEVVAVVAPVAPEVQAILDARTELAAALEARPMCRLTLDVSSAAIAAGWASDARILAARKALHAVEGAFWLPDVTPEGSLRAVCSRIAALRTERSPIEALRSTAIRRGQSFAAARHAHAIEAIDSLLAPLLIERDRLEAVVYPD